MPVTISCSSVKPPGWFDVKAKEVIASAVSASPVVSEPFGRECRFGLAIVSAAFLQHPDAARLQMRIESLPDVSLDAIVVEIFAGVPHVRTFSGELARSTPLLL